MAGQLRRSRQSCWTFLPMRLMNPWKTCAGSGCWPPMNGTSITTLLTLSQLESRFGITVDLRSYHATRTVDDLINLVSGDHSTNP